MRTRRGKTFSIHQRNTARLISMTHSYPFTQHTNTHHLNSSSLSMDWFASLYFNNLFGYYVLLGTVLVKLFAHLFNRKSHGSHIFWRYDLYQWAWIQIFNSLIVCVCFFSCKNYYNLIETKSMTKIHLKKKLSFSLKRSQKSSLHESIAVLWIQNGMSYSFWAIY